MRGFLDQLAARTPTPGGGGAAALTGALAAGLVAMAARFSDRQLTGAGAGDQAGADSLAGGGGLAGAGDLAGPGGLAGADGLADQADELRRRVADLADLDARAYQAVLEARPGRRREALVAAAVVPLEIAEIGARVAAMAVQVAETGNPNLRGDAVTGALLAAASARSAAALVDINVGGREPELSRRAAQAVADACAAADQVMTADR